MKFCPLYSGSSGNSIFVASDKSRILIDAGMPGKRIDAALQAINENTNKIDAIFVTHEHSDHIKGVGVLSRKYDIPIYANEETWGEMASKIGKIKEHNIKLMDQKHVDIGDLTVERFSIPHDAINPTGYAVYNENKKACIATDLGNFTEEIKNVIHDSDILLLECNHDVEMLKFGPYPYVLKRRILSNVGHLSNEACGNAIMEILNDKVKKVFLGHLSKTNNYPDLAYKTVENILQENKVKIGKDIKLYMTNRDSVSKFVEV
jgi:phosphoribosyl 1,2-cyclic phosphodiesterase